MVGAVALAVRRWAPRHEPSVFAAAPRDAWLIVTMDLAALGPSPLAQPLLGAAEGARAGELARLSEACGFDPLGRLRQLMVASPEAGGEPGLAFSGDFTKDELASCAQKVIRARGDTATTTSRGTFTVVEDTTYGHVRLAYRDGGLGLVGRGPWLDAMIDAADGKGGGPPPEHGALRASLTTDGAPPRALLLTALLPAALRQRLKSELGSEVPAGGSDAFAGVLAVEQAGLAVATGAAGSTTEVAVELRCEAPAACGEVEKLIMRKRAALSRDFGARLVGLGPLLDTLTSEVHGSALSARATVPTDDLARALERFAAQPRPRPAMADADARAGD